MSIVRWNILIGPLSLALEMFEADVQPIVDEYLRGKPHRDDMESRCRIFLMHGASIDRDLLRV